MTHTPAAGDRGRDPWLLPAEAECVQKYRRTCIEAIHSVMRRPLLGDEKGGNERCGEKAI